MDNFLSLDLEMNQPSGKIIQIGACVGNLRTGEILESYSRYVKIDEALSEFIVGLTGITDNILHTEGTTLLEAYEGLRELAKRHDTFCNPITWGGGDSRELRDQLLLTQPPIGSNTPQDSTNVGQNTPLNWPFGHRWIDIKTVFQLLQFKRGQKLQAGLAKALIKSGLKFEGKKHNALDDAKNTFRLAHKLMESVG